MVNDRHKYLEEYVQQTPRLDVWVWVLFYVAWYLGDTSTTIIGLELGLREASRSIRVLIESGGYGLLVTAKSVVLVGSLYLYQYARLFVLVPVGVLGVSAFVVVLWNVVQIALLLVYYY